MSSPCTMVSPSMATVEGNRLRRGGGHSAEPVERLGRGGAQLFGQPHGDLLVEVEAAADHARHPPHRVETGRRGQVREHLANSEPSHSDGVAH